jgi:hypothetical protein
MAEFKYEPWMGPTPRSNSPWTSAEDQALLEGWGDGLSNAQLGVRHGRNMGSIDSRLERVIGNGYKQNIATDMYSRKSEVFRNAIVKSQSILVNNAAMQEQLQTFLKRHPEMFDPNTVRRFKDLANTELVLTLPGILKINEQATMPLREIRMWHWKQALKNRRKAREAYLKNVEQGRDQQADFHIKCVQSLNDFLSGTAEMDLLAKKTEKEKQ